MSLTQSKEFEEIINNIFTDDNEKEINKLNDIIEKDPTYDDVLSSFNINSDIVDNINSYTDLCEEVISKDDVSLEEGFFVKLWNTILTIIKRLGSAISNFFMTIVNFFKRLFSKKKTTAEKLNSTNPKEFNEGVDEMMKEIFKDLPGEDLNSKESSLGIEDNMIMHRPITVIAPGKEEKYLKVLSDAYRGSFIGEFRKVSFALDGLHEFQISDKNEDGFKEKVNAAEQKTKEYKEKIRMILIDLEISKDGNIINLNKSNGKQIIMNAIGRIKNNRDYSKDIVGLINPSNCNRMISELTNSVKRIQNKSQNISESLQHTFKKIGTFTSMVVAVTNRLFSACFAYIRNFLMSENVNLKLSEMALVSINKNKDK